MSDAVLRQWVIYDHPKDWPDWYVAREWLIGTSGPPTPTNNMILNRDLAPLRDDVMRRLPGAFRMERFEGDDPVILEVWM